MLLLPATPLGASLGRANILPLSSLFASGEDGLLFPDFTDLTRQFTVSAGTIVNVAADGDPEGMSLESHLWGTSSLSQVLAAQSELVVNGAGSDTTGWTTNNATLTTDGSKFTLTVTTASAPYASRSFATVVGKVYEYSFTLQRGTTPNPNQLRIGNSAGSLGITSSQSAASGTFTGVFTATATTTFISFGFGENAIGQTSIWSNISCKLVPGNHGSQATSTQRPLWKANSGKPYLIFDGADDLLQTPFIPTAAFTMAAAFQCGSASKIVIGGGNSTGNKRAYIGLDASGFLNIGWGTAVSEGANDRRAQNIVVVVTGDGTGRDVYVNGVLTTWGAVSGAPDGTGGGMALGAFNNAGTPSNFADARIYSAVCVNRRVTATEANSIYFNLQRTIQ